MADSFVLFEFDHLMALVGILTMAVGPPLILRSINNRELNQVFATWLGWIMLVYFVFKHLYGPFGLGEAWQIWLPLHMCQLGHMLIVYCLLTGKRGLYVSILYFWTFAGASMALITPDLLYGWPDPNYIMYMVTHGLLLLGALYFTVVEGLRPTVASIWKVSKISIYVMVIIFPLNYIIGGQANYLYLRFPPVVGSLMDFLPAPPLHIPFFVLLAYIAFWLVYLPYFLKDILVRNTAEAN
ncbi:MAG: TIGR02206 family membrane protein [Candidatus Marinimicrobia bacterium]|nr:TIGR02206 family membrane protein [Candidatus Neomarinimicrobiota bacterium]